MDDPAEARGWALRTLRELVDEARVCDPPQLSPAVGAIRTLLEHLPAAEGERLRMTPDEQREWLRGVVRRHLPLMRALIADIEAEREHPQIGDGT